MMAQSSGQELLDKVVNQFNKVNDYSATVVVKADVPMIKVLPVKAKIYYKRKINLKWFQKVLQYFQSKVSQT